MPGLPSRWVKLGNPPTSLRAAVKFPYPLEGPSRAWSRLCRECGDEALEGGDVGDGGAVAGQDQAGVELGELADRAAVLGRVRIQVLGWLVEAGAERQVGDVANHVAADRN